MNLLIALVAIVFIFYLSCLNWRHSVKAVLFIVVIEGILRKWVLPQASEMIYFLKDLVLLGAYLRYYMFSKSERKVRTKGELIKILIFMNACLCVFQAFNPSLGSPIIGFFGLKGYLFYIPLMWMLPSLFKSEEDLYKFLRLYLLLLIPVGLLGVAQFASPQSSPINVYAAGEEAKAGFAGIDKVRITGTFSYIAGYASYLNVCFALLIPMLLRNESRWWKWVSILELALLVANSLMTGSRSVVLFEVLFLVVYLVLMVLKQPSIIKTYIQRFSIPVIICFIAASTLFSSALDAFITRSTSSDNVSERVLDTFNINDFFTYKQLDGFGTGATHQATQIIRETLNLPNGESIPVGFESEFGRIVLELGPFGFIFWYGLRIALIIALWLVFQKLKKPFFRQLALAAFLTHAIQITGQLVVNHTFSVYYWFLAGFIFLLPYLEQIENWHKIQQDFQKNDSATNFASSRDS